MSTQPEIVSFDPKSVRAFRYVARSFDPTTATARFHYALDDRPFEEVFELVGPFPELTPARAAALDRVLRHLFIAAGVSYYKLAAPGTVVVEREPLSEADVEVYRRLYRLGLAEFAFTNDLREWTEPRFEVADATPPGPVDGLGLTDRPLVPLGGGKDSAVAVEALRRAGRDPLLMTVGLPPAIERVVATTGLEHRLVRRTLDPRLHEITRAGGLNGHVPVTAIVSLAAIATAVLHGVDAVVMANERSASVPSFEWSGVEVNHQYSKSITFERDLRSIVANDISGEVQYFSLLRPFSELRIVQMFAGMPDFHHVVTSCNRAFALDEARRAVGWCGTCPKCRFVFLALACFVARREVISVFGRDLLDDDSQTPGYLALLGIDAPKPLECVGEIEESRVAVEMLLEREEWRGARVLDALRARLTPELRTSPDARARLLAVDSEHFVPESYLPVLDALR